METDKAVHCWKEGPEVPRDESVPYDPYTNTITTSCMLPDGHSGLHEWTRDDGIMVKFK